MSRAWRVAARARASFQAKPDRPALVRALLTRQPTAKRRARAPERRRAPGHDCDAGTATGSDIDGADGSVGTDGTGTGSAACAAAVPGTANSSPIAAADAARIHDVPLLPAV